jgi:hypothetical protein
MRAFLACGRYKMKSVFSMSAPPHKWVRVPARAEQTARLLVPEEDQAALEARYGTRDMHGHVAGGEEPLMVYVQRSIGARTLEQQTGKEPTSASAYGSLATGTAMLFSCSQHLMNEAGQTARLEKSYQMRDVRRRGASPSSGTLTLPTAVRQQSPKSRVVVQGTLLGQPKRSTTAAADDDDDNTGGGNTLHILNFFASDRFVDDPLPESPVRSDVRQLPAFQALWQRYDKDHQPDALRRALAHGPEQLPRPRLPVVDQQYRILYMLPPRPGIDRECVRGPRCMCMEDPGNTGRGYVGREFYLPDEERPHYASTTAPRRMCILCRDTDVKRRMAAAQPHGVIPTVPYHTYITTKDFAERILPCELSRRATGIIGPYPDVGECGYDFRRIPPALAIEQGFVDPTTGEASPDAFTKAPVGLPGNFRSASTA